MSLHDLLEKIQKNILSGSYSKEIVDDYQTFWYVTEEIYSGRGVIGILFMNPSFIAKFGKYLTQDERDYIHSLMRDGQLADQLLLV